MVVLMEENRAFDHMLGWMAKGGPQGDTRVNGLTGNECNAKDITKPMTGDNMVCVNDRALDRCPYDPNHAHDATTERIFTCNTASGGTPNTPCSEPTSTTGNASMGGFVQSAIWEKKDGLNEMSMWPSESVPVITTLAKEFANFDHFFCDHPGPTFPNRQFVISGTAHGEQDDEVPRGGFPQKTIYRLLEENGKTWKLYYEDSLAWAIFNADLRRPEAKQNIRPMSEFYTDAAAGTLPNFAFIEPRIAASKNASHLPSLGLMNHQHPTASVREGERLMKNVYEGLRSGPKWNSTLFVLTYDEHGGFFDHVSPPQDGVPQPDNVSTAKGFTYQRLGIRIPTVIISPWIEKGLLVSAPSDAQKQQPTSQWSLSSILATAQAVLGLTGGPLTKRDAWSAKFDGLLETLTEPRTDCPMTLPDVPPPPQGELERQLALPVDEHCEHVIRTMCELVEGYATVSHASNGAFCDSLGICRNTTVGACGSGIRTFEDFSEWRVGMWQQWMSSPQ